MTLRRSLPQVVVVVALTSVSGAAGLVVACDSNNGGNQFGPDIDALPELDGGRRRLPDGAIVEADGAPVTDDDDDDDDDASSTCTGGGTAAVVAGDDGALSAALRTNGGAWKTSTINGGAARSKPGLVAFGRGFLGVTRGSGDALQSFTNDGAVWSAASAIGNGGVKGPPALVVAGTRAHVIFSGGPGGNQDYIHGIYAGTSWNAVTALVGTEGEHSFGGVSAGLGAIGENVYFAQNGSDQGLYARPYTDDDWKGAIAVQGAGTIGTDPQVPASISTPEIASLKGKFALVIAYQYKKSSPSDPNAVAYATHSPGGIPEWGNLQTNFVTGPTTGVLSGSKLSLTSLSDTTVALAFKGDDGNGYVTIGTATTNPGSPLNWTDPVAVGGAPTAVDNAPAVAKGDCGDEAIFAFATGGIVKYTSLKDGTFTPVRTVQGITGANVAIATR